MSTPPRRRRARRRRNVLSTPLVVAFVAVFVFLLGVAVGEALHDNPKPGGTQTHVRTFRP